MRRLILILGLLVLVIPVGFFLIWDVQTRALGNALLADLSAAKKKVIQRDPRPRAPIHDNGYQCLGSMLDVSPKDFGPFSAKNRASLDEFITGQKPISELSPELRANMMSLSPWAVSLRSCGDSMQLAWVEGLSPWTNVNNPRWVRFHEAMPALIEFTALELRVLLADGQPEVALERCSATWAMVADQSHLGMLGAMYARMSVRRLAPACGLALASVAPEVRAQLATQWAPLRQRLASTRELMEGQRLATTLEVFAWVSGDAIRTQLGNAVGPATPDLLTRLRVGRTWRAWDAAMRELTATAEVPGPERVRASAAVDAIVESKYGDYLASYEEAPVLLELLADLAAGGKKPLASGVTKQEKGLEYVNAQNQKLLIPMPPSP